MNEIERKVVEVQLGVLKLQHLLLKSQIKGDLPGHPFRGNQFSGGGGGGGGDSGKSLSTSARNDSIAAQQKTQSWMAGSKSPGVKKIKAASAKAEVAAKTAVNLRDKGNDAGAEKQHGEAAKQHVEAMKGLKPFTEHMDYSVSADPVMTAHFDAYKSHVKAVGKQAPDYWEDVIGD